jgi:hypothetical protein
MARKHPKSLPKEAVKASKGKKNTIINKPIRT